jgi:iron complex transport system substrate-binding protein
VFGREAGSLRSIYASGGVGFLHELLEIAGGRDVFDNVARESLQVSTEVLLARRPEVIIELRPSATTPTGIAAERAVWNRLAALPAVRDDRIHILTDSGLVVPGPRVAETARAFSEAIAR